LWDPLNRLQRHSHWRAESPSCSTHDALVNRKSVFSGYLDRAIGCLLNHETLPTLRLVDESTHVIDTELLAHASIHARHLFALFDSLLFSFMLLLY
jgi:hypothetical protein